MYLKHFGLTCFPYSPEIAADDTFESSGAKELKVRLHHLIELRGVGLVTGDSGSGKTTGCRTMLSTLHSGLFKTMYVPLSTGNAMDLYKCIAWELGLNTERNRAGLYRQIRNEVSRLCADAHTRPVLVIDEAHNLRSDVIEELRLLTNYAMDSENRLCLLLCGQSELRRRLGLAVHEALNQRIVVRYHLSGLVRDELAAYLAHRLRLAGTELPLFEPAAIEAIFQATKALPRKVNSLAHHALTAAALSKAKSVNPDHVAAALPEVQ